MVVFVKVMVLDSLTLDPLHRFMAMTGPMRIGAYKRHKMTTMVPVRRHSSLFIENYAFRCKKWGTICPERVRRQHEGVTHQRKLWLQAQDYAFEID